MNTDIRIAILTLSRGIIQSKADPLRREKLCPNLLSPKFADAQMSSNFLPKFFVLKYIEPKVLAHKFLNIKVYKARRYIYRGGGPKVSTHTLGLIPLYHRRDFPKIPSIFAKMTKLVYFRNSKYRLGEWLLPVILTDINTYYRNIIIGPVRQQQEMRPLFFCGWPLNFPIRDGVFYHIPYNLGTSGFTIHNL